MENTREGCENSMEDDGFTTAHISKKSKKKIKYLTKLVAKEIGFRAKGYDSLAFAIDRTIEQLAYKYPEVK
jgi:hypothetical protein